MDSVQIATAQLLTKLRLPGSSCETSRDCQGQGLGSVGANLRLSGAGVDLVEIARSQFWTQLKLPRSMCGLI